MESNIFDQFDDDPELQPGTAPGLGERFMLNFDDAQRKNTIGGAIHDASTESRRKDRHRHDDLYEAFPEWQGFSEGAAALGGQIAGTAASVENFVPVGLGARVVAGTKGAVTGLWARVFAGSVDSAAVNAVSDAAIQGIEIGAEFREEFDPVQYGASVLLGAGIGGAGGALAHGVDLAKGKIRERGGSQGLKVDQAGERSAVIDAPADPARGIEAEPLHGQKVTILEDQSGVRDGAVKVRLEDGTEHILGERLVQEVEPDVKQATVPEPASASEPVVSPDADPVPQTLGESLSESALEAHGLNAQKRRIADELAGLPDDKPSRPPTLSEFLAGEGGLKLDAGGELAARDLDKKFVPGRGHLVRSSGKDLDYAREAAAEAGYFDHLYGTSDEAVAKSTVNDLLELLDQDIRSRDVFALKDAEQASQWQTVRDVKQARAELRDTIDQIYEGGTDLLPDKTVIRTIEHMRNEGLSADDALERAFIEEYNAGGSKERFEGIDGTEIDIPFDRRAGRTQREEIQNRGGKIRGRGEGAPSEPRQPAGRSGRSEAAQFLNSERPGTQNRLTGTERKRPQSGRSGDGGAAQPVARVRETAEALAKALNIPSTRQGRIRGSKQVLGQYNSKSGGVRVQSLDDFDTLTHEYGHHLDNKIPEIKEFISRNSKALEPLDYDGSKQRDFEGFAEFFRLWLTNRPYVQKQFPELSADFAKVLDNHPELVKGIDAAADAWTAFMDASSQSVVASTIVSSKRQGWVASARKELRDAGIGGTISDVLQRMYTAFIDDLNPIQATVRHLSDLHHANTGRHLDLKVTEDPYKLARMSRGAFSAGQMDIKYGVVPYRGLNPESPSLRDAIIEATGKPNDLSAWDENLVRDFGSYLWSRRAIGEWDRFRSGDIPNPPDKLTKGDHIQNVKDLEAAYPRFASAAQKAYEFNRALWKKKLDAGLIDKKTYSEGLAIKDYVPGLRDFSTSKTDEKVKGIRGKASSLKSSIAKRFRGSKRDVINPLESMAADAYETSAAIARNDVLKALHRLAKVAGVGGAQIAEEIPVKHLQASMVDPLEAVESAARNAGLGKADTMVIRDALESAIGDEKAAIFRPAMISENGEPIVFFRDGGDLKALRLADGKFGQDMYAALTMMSPAEKNFWIELVAMPARVLRMGITTSLDFIGANFIRDQAMAAIYYGKPLQRVERSLQGAADDILGTETARTYSRVFGISGGQETASLSDVRIERDLMKLKRKGWATQRLTSFRGLLQTAEVAETASRMGLFRTFNQEAKARGLDDFEAALEASYRARDYIDFDRRGAVMGALAKITPFLNASLQGLDKTSRHMLLPLARKALGKSNGPEDARALSEAVKTWARMGVVTAGSASLYALMSRHEDHDEISTYTRSTHWTVKVGDKWLAIPKPFELATIFNLAEATFETIKQKDPVAYNRWMDSLHYSLTPPSVMEGNPLIKSYFEVRTNTSLFSEMPIVPDHLQALEPHLQYTARTSAFSKQLGEAFELSPVIIDHLIMNHLASWGRSALSLYDMAQPDAPRPGWDDAPITRRFIKDAAKGSQSVTQFWDLMATRSGALEGKAQSWKALGEFEREDFYASQDTIGKAYIALSTHKAEVKRLHPLVRARNAVQAINTLRREMASGTLRNQRGEPQSVDTAARTAADDILGTLPMAITRNALRMAGVEGWAQRTDIDEDGFYRELEAVDPALLQTLGSLYAEKKVWSAEAVERTWPDLQERLLSEGTSALTLDLVAGVEAEGYAIFGGLKRPKPTKPEVRPSGG